MLFLILVLLKISGKRWKNIYEMILDTNVIIKHIRKKIEISSRGIVPIVVVGELQAFALKADWGYQKILIKILPINKSLKNRTLFK